MLIDKIKKIRKHKVSVFFRLFRHLFNKKTFNWPSSADRTFRASRLLASSTNATWLSSRVKLFLPKKIVSLKILQKKVIFKGGYLARSCKITSLDRLGSP